MVNSLLNNKISHWCKLKAFADDKSNVINKLKFVSGWVENIVGKGENAGYQHFPLLPQCFQNASHTGVFKVKRVGELPAIFIKFKIVVCKLFQLEESSLKFVVWERVDTAICKCFQN